MALYEIIIISIAISLEVFSIVVRKGSLVANIDKKKIAQVIVFFSAWQLAALLLGDFIAKYFAITEASDKGIRFCNALTIFILGYLAVKMFRKAFKLERLPEKREDNITTKQVVLISFLLSVNAFLIGVGFGLLETNIVLAVVTVTIVTVLMTILGYYSGYRLGDLHRVKAYVISGILLLGTDIELAAKLFG